MKSKICPYRSYCKNECLDCDFSITFEKQNKKIKNLKKKLETSQIVIENLRGLVKDLESRIEVLLNPNF